MGTQLNLNTGTVGSIVIGIPEATEQTLIADYLDKTTAVTATVEAAIDRLVEYRQAVITSAVTGKIDVRGFRHSGASRNPVDEQAGAQGLDTGLRRYDGEAFASMAEGFVQYDGKVCAGMTGVL